MIYTIISFLVILIVLILAHELGHFVTAKLTGIKVEEFGIGFPPRIYGRRIGETVYSINALPLGGFVKMAGEENPAVERSFASKSVPVRLLVLSAGSLVNLLLPILLFGFSFMVPRQVLLENIFVQEVTAASPAESAGILPGDRIIAVNGEQVNNVGDLHYIVQLKLGGEIKLTVGRGEEKITRQLIARWKPPPGEGPLGINIKADEAGYKKISEPFWRAFPKGARSTWETLILFRNQIVSNIVNKTVPEMAGPVGIAQITGVVVRVGLAPLMSFTALLSLNLGIINIFPLPALDGGRIAFVLLEVIRRGKRISPRHEGVVHLIGYFLLLSAVFILTYYDIVRIIQGEGLFR